MRYLFLSVVSLLVLSACLRPAGDDKSLVDLNSNVQETEIGNESENFNSQMPELRQATFNMEEIANHKSAEDCWLLIRGKVYDVTGFIAGGKHGGGDAILEGCGIDSTELYETRPMGSGTPHSAQANQFLESFYIGQLQQ